MLPSSNALLAHLPPHEYDLLTANMQLVCLQRGQTLFNVGETPAHVYYPVGAIVSMLCDLEEGHTVETHFLGATCMVGLGTVGSPSFYRAAVRTPGLAHKLSVQDFQAARAQCPTYVLRSMNSLNRVMAQINTSIVCIKHHSATKQLIRWLLRSYDRLLDPVILMTHSEIAELLGFRREAISLTLKLLAETGAITTRRGEVELLDRKILEEHACECYEIDIRYRKQYAQ
jgi:CRP-like cAMP-binding protein